MSLSAFARDRYLTKEYFPGVVGWTRCVFNVSAIGLMTGLPWLLPNFFIVGFLGYTLLIVHASTLTLMRAFWMSLASGGIALTIAFHWAAQSIFDTTNLPYSLAIVVFVGLIAWESLAFGFLGLATSVLASKGRRMIWWIIPVWIVIQTHFPKIFGWATAHAYLSFPPILQVAEFAGTAGVTACIMVGSVALARLISSPRCRLAWSEAIATIMFLTLACVWGHFAVTHWDDVAAAVPKLRVAAIQVDPSFVVSLERMQTRSDRVKGKVDLILWPESTLGNYHTSLDHFGEDNYTYDHAEMPNPAVNPYPNIHCDLLAGGKTYDDGGRGIGPYKNTVFLIDRNNYIIDRYVKRSLLPIGEYVPGEQWIPQLRDWAALETELIRGASDIPVNLSNGVRAGILVCYEDMVAANASSTVREGAECLVAIVNGSAFVDPDTLRQHLLLAQFRTIENRRSMIRCAATGVTCLINPSGRIVEQLPLFQDDMLVTEVPLIKNLTFYSKHGEWFSGVATIMTAGLFFYLYMPLATRFKSRFGVANQAQRRR